VKIFGDKQKSKKLTMEIIMATFNLKKVIQGVVDGELNRLQFIDCYYQQSMEVRNLSYSVESVGIFGVNDKPGKRYEKLYDSAKAAIELCLTGNTSRNFDLIAGVEIKIKGKNGKPQKGANGLPIVKKHNPVQIPKPSELGEIISLINASIDFDGSLILDDDTPVNPMDYVKEKSLPELFIYPIIVFYTYGGRPQKMWAVLSMEVTEKKQSEQEDTEEVISC
jgi:hypothetical protein